MSRAVMQQALEALEWNYNTDLDNIPACEQWAKMLKETITALKQALAEPEQPISSVTEAVTKTVIEIEKLLCEKLGRKWQASGMSIETLINELASRKALAEPEKPVAFIEPAADNDCACAYADGWNACVRAYTAPTPRKPVELTDDEIALIVGECAASAHRYGDFSFARAVIAAYEAKQGEQT